MSTTTTTTAPAEDPPEAAPPTELRGSGFLVETGQLAAFAGQAFRALPGTVRYTAEILRQASAILLTTTPLLLLMSFFFGVITQTTGYFLLAPLGAADYMGAIVGFGTHVSPVMMFACTFTAKVGGGYAAELGAMRINQEIDAYETTGVDPLRYVVGTRLLATVLYIPIGAVAVLLGYYAGSYLNGLVILEATDLANFSRFSWASQSPRDLAFVFTTVALTGLTTAIVACHYGLRASGGPTAVGTAVAQATKLNLVLCNVIMALTVVLWYSVDAGVPIGG
ncbi:ABC transporter permease [Patulibacter brassicae]|uniref:ABC transporter permease n=1 Tax=Patulibacter brassicae TaxID=1705717 RepID=A0ABU4VMA9_9ACTN|nr:ABC transporter permease [Patulibacter brassicae]MDX8152976.1 ABC transporter permease [Patulibacter brassicae]